MNRQQGVFVFEADTAAFANRKRAARACASCQKRKKRCPHTFTKSLDGQNGVGNDAADKVLPNLAHKEPIRFVGDLNPESILTDLSTATNEKQFSRIGTWVEQSRLLQQEQIRRDAENVANAKLDGGAESSPAEVEKAKHAELIKALAVERYRKVENGRRVLTGHQKSYLQAVGAFRVLPKETSDALIKLYMSRIDAVLPIIDGKKFQQDYAAGEASVWLIQAICLVACKTEKARPYLRLSEDGQLLDPIAFARNLHTGLDAAMKADLEADRFRKIQIMTLMSLHNDGPGGIEESSAHLIQAIHDAQTTGVHIHTPGRTRNDQGAMLWWTLWMLDRFNACLGGRPLMISDRDIDINKPSLESTARSQAMGAWLQIGNLLDRVIEYYRPTADPEATGWEDDFPDYKDLTSGLDLNLIESAHRHLLEICYNIIGILACRNGGPTTASYMRRIKCSDRIQELVSDKVHKGLPPIPLVPYAVSLSLTVAYRGLRDHYSDPGKALSDLTARCEILEGLSKTWWTADAMTKLGRKALKSLQNPTSQSSSDLRQKSAESGDVSDAMEAEVTPCKFGPFIESKNKDLGSHKSVKPSSSSKLAVPEVRKPSTSQQSNPHGSGNALQVLSDAAATHGLPVSATHRFSIFGVGDDDPDRKRRRFGVSPLGNFTNVNQNGLTSFPSTIAHTNNLGASIANSAQSASTPSFQDPTPGSANTPATSLLATDPNTDHLPDPFGSFHPDYHNPTAFSDLDNLFDGFFDLSMPTMFQDPLFEGAAYFGVDEFNSMMENANSMVDSGGFGYHQSQNMLVPGLPSGITGNMGMGTTNFGAGGSQGSMG